MTETRPAVEIEPPDGLPSIDWHELFAARELLVFLIWRDIKVRYKQSLLGAFWVLLQPALTTLIFTVLFLVLVGADSAPTARHAPYAVSTFCAMVPWLLFSSGVNVAGNSLVAHREVITRVYFPRLLIPIAAVLGTLVDFGIGLTALVVVLVAFGVAPASTAVALPLFVLLALAAAIAVSLWLSALNALFRDVRFTIPFLLQIWMFASPVVYDTGSLLGGRPPWLEIIYGLNPMAGVVEGFRWALLGGEAPWLLIALAAGVSTLLLAVGLYFFKRLEPALVDLV